MPSSTHVGDARPLLTLAIPTFNRSEQLAQLLAVLETQLRELPVGFSRENGPLVEVLISNNASADTTAEIVAQAQSRFAMLSVPNIFTPVHQPENIGADANFAFCYRRAQGTFLWICGDDDLLAPGALSTVLGHLQNHDGTPAEIDLIYATSYAFRSDYLGERQHDPFDRRFHTITSAHQFAMVVNIMFTFISGIIVNKARLETLPHEAPEAFIGTNLVQLSWSLPLLLHHRRSIVLWQRPVAGHVGGAHGYSFGRVFGEQLSSIAQRILPNRPDLYGPILNFALRRWFPSIVIDVRGSTNETLQLAEAESLLRRVFGHNPRYWIFTYPALAWPLPVAKLYTRFTAALSKIIYMAHLPGFWKKQT
jgi:abequosyltransferase